MYVRSECHDGWIDRAFLVYQTPYVPKDLNIRSFVSYSDINVLKVGHFRSLLFVWEWIWSLVDNQLLPIFHIITDKYKNQGL